MTERSGQIRQTTTAEVRLDHGKVAGSGPATLSISPLLSISPFGCQRVGCDRIPLQRASPRRKIAPSRPGIRGMSAKPDDTTGSLEVFRLAKRASGLA